MFGRYGHFMNVDSMNDIFVLDEDLPMWQSPHGLSLCLGLLDKR
jgi:hypothetical protein